MLAVVLDEKGADVVRTWIPEGIASAVSVAEVGTKLVERGDTTEAAMRTVVATLGVQVVPFDEDTAYAASLLRLDTKKHGLSLGDRACLALGARRGLPVLTADQSWAALDIGVDVHLIRSRV